MAGHRHGFDGGIFFLLAFLLLFAPLIKGGNRPMPLLVLELASLPLLGYLAWRPTFLGLLPKTFLFALGLLILFPLVQWLPLPVQIWQMLPGREAYAAALLEFGQEGGMTLRQLSLVPSATEAAWLAMLPPVAVLLLTVGLQQEKLKQMIYVFLGMAAFQAVLGLIQFGGGSHGEFRISLSDVGTGLGTYANRNHLAGLLEMALPLSLGLLAARFGRLGSGARYAGRSWLRRMASLLTRLPRPNQSMLFAALFILLLLGLIFTRSRSGIVMGMVGVFLSALFFGRHLGGTRSNSLVTLFVAIGLALAVEIGLTPVLEKFSAEDALADARWTIYASSMKALWEFFPFGSGLGTFPEVYWRFQPDSIAQFVNHAHNDYLEFVLEGGLPAAVAVVMFLALYALRWPSLLRRTHWGTCTFMQVGAGIGLLLMALHSLTDFNLHIPANAIYFAFLAGVFFHRNEHIHVARPVINAPQPEDGIAALPNLLTVQVRGKNPFSE